MVYVMTKALLPAGFHDSLFPEAARETAIVESLLACFAGYGYQRVNPPVFEFEESLFAGAGQSLAQNTFRVMDPLSRHMMGVRADMTVQIARMANSRLVNTPLPLRLSYAGDVFRVAGEGLHAQRQLTQAGIELIGSRSIHADVEVLTVAVEALQAVGITDVCIDFTLPGLVDQLLKGNPQSEPLLTAIRHKDKESIQRYGGEQADVLVRLVQTDISLESLASLPLPASAKTLVARLAQVITALEQRVQQVHISIDPLESLKFPYHEDVGFSIFSKQARGELGRGGRYATERGESGIGVTLYVNEIFRTLPKPADKPRVFLPLGVNTDVAPSLREQGYIPLFALETHADVSAEARRMGCAFVWDNQLRAI